MSLYSHIKKHGVILVVLAFSLGFVATCVGLLRMTWPSVLPWSNSGALARFLLFLSVCSCFVVAVSFWLKRNAFFSGGVIAAGIALLSGNLWPFFVVLWFAVSSVLAGQFILKVFRITPEEDSYLISLLVGAGVYGTAVGISAHFPVNYSGLYGAALLIPIILSRRTVLQLGKKFFCRVVNDCASPAVFKVNIFDVAIAVVSLVYFVVALMPEVGFDALATHLFVPAQLATRHQWGFDVKLYVWSVFPMLGDWIFSVGYMLAGESGARLINVGFVFILAGLARSLVFWAGGTSTGARWAALVFLSTPLTFAEGSTLYIDSVWAAFSVAGVWKILSICSCHQRKTMTTSALLLGFALASKVGTFYILVVLSMVMILRYRTWVKTVRLSSFTIDLSLFLLFSLIPYVTAWFLTSNPLFPFFNAVFKSPYYVSTSNFDATLLVYSQKLSWDILYRWTFEAGKYLEATAGAAGFQWLLLFLPTGIILATRRNQKGIALFGIAILIVGFVFYSLSYLRYVFPAWVIFSAAIGASASVDASKHLNLRFFWVSLAIGAVLLNLLFLVSGASYRDFSLIALVSENNRNHYLINTMPIRYAVKLVNVLNVNRAPVAVFAEPKVAGLESDALYPRWYNISFQEEIIRIQTEMDAVEVLSKRGVEYVILDSNWKGTHCCPDGGVRQKLIEAVTEPIAKYNAISVRKIKTASLFKIEILINPDFEAAAGWNFPVGANYNAENGIVSANVSSAATQYVAVASGRRYLYTIVARSGKEDVLGRMQINWMDKNGKFLNAEIQVFSSKSSWSQHMMEVIAPLNAAGAVVYVGGHSSDPIEFDSCSFRR